MDFSFLSENPGSICLWDHLIGFLLGLLSLTLLIMNIIEHKYIIIFRYSISYTDEVLTFKYCLNY